MFIPLILLVLGALIAAVIAFGANPSWAQFHGGLELILLSRRLQTPLIALLLILCLAMLVMIITGRRRAWWLIGLGPILALLAHRFVLDPDRIFVVNTQPAFVPADQATFLADDDWVVGISGTQDVTAYPYSALYAAPLVVQSAQQPPMLLMWSPFANRALAVEVDRTIKPEELEIVSMPGNALLVYNARLGQFINGVTGRTMDGQKPSGFGRTLATTKTTWKQWKATHPQTRVLAPPILAKPIRAPHRPVVPFYPMPAEAADPAHSTAVLLAGDAPAAALDSQITAAPVNMDSPEMPVVLLRDRDSGIVKGFRRQTGGDLWPVFREKKFPKIEKACMTDSDSGSAWTADGVAVAGPLKGQKLSPIEVDDGVFLSVLRMWYPKLILLQPMKDQ